MTLDDYLRIDPGAARFLMPDGDGGVTLRPEEIEQHREMYDGLAIRLAGPIALLEPPAAGAWEGLARIILEFRQLGCSTAHQPDDLIEFVFLAKLMQISSGAPIEGARIIIAHAFMARVEALNRGYAGVPETVQ
jgi:hypothetical protein